jgi:hypothetical protein
MLRVYSTSCVIFSEYAYKGNGALLRETNMQRFLQFCLQITKFEIHQQPPCIFSRYFCLLSERETVLSHANIQISRDPLDDSPKW